MHAKDKIENKTKKHVPSVRELEADVAYFDARLSLLGKPATCYQKAQEVVYRMLEGMLIQTLMKKRIDELKNSSRRRSIKPKSGENQ